MAAQRGPRGGDRRRLQMRLALALTAIGIVITAAHIHADSEPGALPLPVTLLGIAWWVIARWRRC